MQYRQDRRRAYLKKLSRLTPQQQSPHFALILAKIIDRLNRTEVNHAHRVLPTKQVQ
jgi:hypothetical protein